MEDASEAECYEGVQHMDCDILLNGTGEISENLGKRTKGIPTEVLNNYLNCDRASISMEVWHLNAFEYKRPKSLREASVFLVEYGSDAHILNGGTDLIIRMRERLTMPAVVVDIKNIPDLNKLTFNEGKGLFIGACVNLNILGADKDVMNNYPYLSRAALSVGSVQVRNRATCAGNLCNASPLADTATPLLALDAVILVYGPEGEKEIPVRDFFIHVRKTCLKPGELVWGIRIPPVQKGQGVFMKLSRRKEVDLSTVCSTVLKTDKGWRIAYGAVAPTPIRIPRTEALLDSAPLTPALIEEAAALTATEVSPIGDNRSSREYRLSMVQVLMKRSLQAIMEKEGQQ